MNQHNHHEAITEPILHHPQQLFSQDEMKQKIIESASERQSPYDANETYVIPAHEEPVGEGQNQLTPRQEIERQKVRNGTGWLDTVNRHNGRG